MRNYSSLLARIIMWERNQFQKRSIYLLWNRGVDKSHVIWHDKWNDTVNPFFSVHLRDTHLSLCDLLGFMMMLGIFSDPLPTFRSYGIFKAFYLPVLGYSMFLPQTHYLPKIPKEIMAFFNRSLHAVKQEKNSILK